MSPPFIHDRIPSSARPGSGFARVAIASLISFFLSEMPASGGDGHAITSQLIQSNLEDPTFVAAAPGDPNRLFIVEQHGRIRLLLDGVLQETPFLDLDAIVPDQSFNGMLGLCFDPDYESNGFFYVQHTLSWGRVSVARYTTSRNPNVADPQSRETVLELEFPGVGHHVGGWIGFGPDGYLYIPLGDGHTTSSQTPGSSSQSLDAPWGKILRVDVHGEDAYPADEDRNFAIPPDNPFIGVGLGEIFARGLRNPFRADFDDETGDLWIADVGLFEREEINLITGGSGGGQNFGWACAEGSICDPALDCVCDELIEPVHEYTHQFGCSITGGSVYNGCAIEGMQGRFFFGDWCSGRIWSCRRVAGSLVDVIEHTSSLDVPGQPDITRVTGIGVGADGELVVVSGSGNLFRIVPEGDPAHCSCPGDFDGSGVVDGADIGLMLSTWGAEDADTDLDGNGLINGADLGLLLGFWGPCA